MPLRCATLWIGSSLGPVERACLRSVLRQGHQLDLYCYAVPSGVPDGVAVSDAARILPESSIVRHQSGSVALFANRFRYELQRRSLGTWVDCDAYLLRPLDETSDYLLGEFEPGRVNTGVLRLPPDSPVLKPLLQIFDERKVLPWLPLAARIAAQWRLATTGRIGLAQLPWGSAGPIALTYLAHAHGIARYALPPEVLYPVRWQDADWVRNPAIGLEQVITERTVSIHLWNERIKHLKDLPAAPGSFLAQIQAEGAIEAVPERIPDRVGE